MKELWKELLTLSSLLWLAIQDKKYLGITRPGLVAASVLLLLAGCFNEVSLWFRLGGFALGLLLLVFAFFSNETIGMADGVIIAVCGTAFGIYESAMLSFFAMLYAAIFSFVLLLLKKVGRKSRIPFLPFLLLGYVTMRLFVKSI